VPECEGSACQGLPGVAPALQEAGSERVDGLGGRGAAQVKVKRKSTAGATARLKIAVPEHGVLSVTGYGIRPVTGKVAKAGTSTVAVHLKGAQARALRRSGRLTVTLEVRFAPDKGQASTTTVSVTFRDGNFKGGK
jgi:hypothetical protein